MSFEEVTLGSARLIRGDCREVLPTLDRVDAVITDPPYGVELKTRRYRVVHGRAPGIRQRPAEYASYVDSDENFRSVVLPALAACRTVANARLIFMSDRRVFDLPSGGYLGGIFVPNGCGMGPWGFQCFMHCVFYGKDPYLAARLGSRPNGKTGLWGNDSNRVDHPCAKPLAAMEWAVTRASLPGHVAVDPFMGSGTTGVACAQLGRSFIGIEIEPRYFDIACERIAAAQTIQAAA